MSDEMKACPACRRVSPNLYEHDYAQYVRYGCECGVTGPWADPDDYDGDSEQAKSQAKSAARERWNDLPRDDAPSLRDDAATLDDLARIAYEACVGPRDKHPGLAHFERHSESYRRDWRNAVQAVLAASPGRTEPLRWTAEPPRVPGEYRARWISIPQYPRWLTVTAAMIAEATPEFWARSEYAGPIPEPIDADAPTLREEAAAVLVQLDELAVIWGDEGVFRRCRDRLRAALERSDA